jgi:hypothetical protein
MDAERLALKLRDVNPALTWSNLVRWGRDDPERLITLAFALLAMLPVDTHNTRDLLAWTEPPPRTRRAATRRADHG